MQREEGLNGHSKDPSQNAKAVQKEAKWFTSTFALTVTACIFLGVAVVYIKYKHRREVVREAFVSAGNVLTENKNSEGVCFREPVYSRVPPKVHWSTCQADWCRPL
jgi:negative regulator of sigma E activity